MCPSWQSRFTNASQQICWRENFGDVFRTMLAFRAATAEPKHATTVHHVFSDNYSKRCGSSGSIIRRQSVKTKPCHNPINTKIPKGSVEVALFTTFFVEFQDELAVFIYLTASENLCRIQSRNSCMERVYTEMLLTPMV